jgi:putative oxidoreductase
MIGKTSMSKLLSPFAPYREVGLLLLRVGIGIMFILHGYPKLVGGPEKWAAIGAMGIGSIGVESGLAFWGFMAALSEFGGGILVLAGFLFRPALVLLVITMIFAAAYHVVTDSGSPYHAIEAGILFFSLLWIGPGKYSLDQKLFSHEREGGSDS